MRSVRGFAPPRRSVCTGAHDPGAFAFNSMNSNSTSIPSPAPGAGVAAAASQKSYGQILKSSALIGGSSMVEIVAGMVRVKAMALLLGPAGFGLMGLFTSIFDLTRSIAGMGVNTSGVRQIAEAAGTGDAQRVARTAAVLRRTSFFLGILGALVLVVFCRQISVLTFDTPQYAGGVALLSLAVLIRTVGDGRGALLQGLRRIADLAKSSVIGSVVGILICVPLLYFLREEGVVPMLIAAAGTSFALTWWFAHKAGVERVKLTAPEMLQEVRPLLRLGLAFMASGLLMMGVAYAIRIMVLRHENLAAAGFYSSAWSLGGLYIGIILQAMGADFYPRLTAIAKDNEACNRTVNEQAEISLLLAGPGVLATLTVAPLVIYVLYSSEFRAAVPLLRWICLGMTLRVISWPMGFILLAKGLQRPFMASEFLWAGVHVGLAWLGLHFCGLNGAGMAFFGSYVFHVVLIYTFVHRISGFRWSAVNLKLCALFLSLIGAVFCGFQFLPLWPATILGGVAAAGSAVFSLRTLAHLVSIERLPRPVRKVLVWLRLAPSAPPA